MPADTLALPALARTWSRANVPGTRPATFESPGAVVTVRDRGLLHAESHPFTVAAWRPGAALEGATCPMLLQSLEHVGGRVLEYVGAPADVRGRVDLARYIRGAKNAESTFGLVGTRRGDVLTYTDSFIARVDLAPDAWRGNLPGYTDSESLPIILQVPACMRRDLRVGYLHPGAFPGDRHAVALAYSESAGLVLAVCLPPDDVDRVERAARAVAGILENVAPDYQASSYLDALTRAGRGILPSRVKNGKAAPVRIFAADDVGASGDVLVAESNLHAADGLTRVYGAGPIRPLEVSSADGSSRAIIMPMQDRAGNLERES